MNNFVLVTDEADECLYFVHGDEGRISPKFLSHKDALSWLFSYYKEAYYEIGKV